MSKTIRGLCRFDFGLEPAIFVTGCLENVAADMTTSVCENRLLKKKKKKENRLLSGKNVYAENITLQETMR